MISVAFRQDQVGSWPAAAGLSCHLGRRIATLAGAGFAPRDRPWGSAGSEGNTRMMQGKVLIPAAAAATARRTIDVQKQDPTPAAEGWVAERGWEGAVPVAR
jgi:hypothetical protein